MKKNGKNLKESFELTEATIPQIIQKIKDYMVDAGKMKSVDVATIASSFRKALKKWAIAFPGKEAILYFEKKFRFYHIELALPGTEACDPYEEDTKDEDANYSELYHDLSDSYAYVIYSYQNGENTLLFNFRASSSSSLPMVIALLAAVTIGLLLRFCFTDAGAFISEHIIDPLCSKFISMLTMIATPMMFFLLLNAICRLGTRRELSQLGKRLMGGVWKMPLILSVSGIGLCMLAFGFYQSAVSTQSANQFAAIRDLILNFIPDSIASPFLTGNALQIVFLALIIGITIFIKKSQNETLINVNGQLDGVFQMIMTAINNIMPVYIFMSLTSLIIEMDLSEILSLWKLFALFFAVVAVYYIVLILRIVLVAKCSPFKVIKAILPAYLTALMTASSLAAFNHSLRCCTRDFKIPEKEAKFFLSTGRTLHKPCGSALYILTACFFAYLSGSVNMNIAWYIMAFITGMVLGVATPPIPGGGKTCYTILFLQLGIPVQWLALVMALDAVFDFFCTSSDVAGLLTTILVIHKKKERKEKAKA